MTLSTSLRAARRVSTPLITIRTPDMAMTTETIEKAVTNGHVAPLLVWDCVRGCQWRNGEGMAAAWHAMGRSQMNAKPPADPTAQNTFRTDLAKATIQLVNLLEMCMKLPEDTVVIVMNMHMHWDKPLILQAAWNLRDHFKADFRTLIMLTDNSAIIPSALRDALPLVEELPTTEELGAIVEEQFEAATGKKPDDETRAKAIDAVCGLPAFSAEQSIALSFEKKGEQVVLNVESAWDRKRALIEQTNGLSVWHGKDNFSTLGGLRSMKNFMLDVLQGNDKPRLIVLIDEIADAFAGSGADGGGDSSGTTQEMQGTFLSEMQNREYPGAILLGPPGTGKSQFSKSLAGEAGCPCVMLDISKMKSKYVGSSNENLHAALSVIHAISQGKALFLSTCNALSTLTPQMKRRFNLGIFFLDLPDFEEREAIWQGYLNHYQLDAAQKRPNDEGWTGADIKQCCNLAWRLNKPLMHVASFLTPVSQTDAERINALRQGSSGKFLSASYPGKYTFKPDVPAEATGSKRRSYSIKEN